MNSMLYNGPPSSEKTKASLDHLMELIDDEEINSKYSILRKKEKKMTTKQTNQWNHEWKLANNYECFTEGDKVWYYGKRGRWSPVIIEEIGASWEPVKVRDADGDIHKVRKRRLHSKKREV